VYKGGLPHEGVHLSPLSITRLFHYQNMSYYPYQAESKCTLKILGYIKHIYINSHIHYTTKSHHTKYILKQLINIYAIYFID